MPFDDADPLEWGVVWHTGAPAGRVHAFDRAARDTAAARAAGPERPAVPRHTAAASGRRPSSAAENRSTTSSSASAVAASTVTPAASTVMSRSSTK